MTEQAETHPGVQVQFTGHLLRDGFIQLNNSIVRSKRLSVNDKMIFALLLSRADRAGESFPGHDSIGKDLGISRWTVMRGLKILQAYGLVSWQRRGQGRTCNYLLHEEAISSFVAQETCGTQQQLEVAPAHSKKLQLATSRSSTHATQKNTHIRIHKVDTPNGVSKKVLTKGQEHQFKAFWQEYPRKEGKGAAEKAWMKIKPSSELVEEILTSLGRWKACPQWQDQQFIPYPQRWLNERRWEDEPSLWSTERSNNGRNAQPGPGPPRERAGARFDNSDEKYQELAKHDIG